MTVLQHVKIGHGPGTRQDHAANRQFIQILAFPLGLWRWQQYV